MAFLAFRRNLWYDSGNASYYEREAVMDCLRVVLSVLIPPLGVFLQVGFGLQFWLNILLTLLGYIPGLVHAIWVIATH
jgi:uncharacterized membrane protein YqaE (UPF0057 family)